MQDNLNGQLTILKSQLEELAISFGEMLMPVIRKVVTAVQGFVDKLNNMDEAQRKTIITIGLVIAALGPFLVILGTVISTVGKSMKAYASAAKGIKKLMVAVKSGTGIFGKLGTALGGISAPVLAIVAVIAVLVAAFTHLWKTNDGFRENIIATWTQIKETVNNFCQGILEQRPARVYRHRRMARLVPRRLRWPSVHPDRLCGDRLHHRRHVRHHRPRPFLGSGIQRHSPENSHFSDGRHGKYLALGGHRLLFCYFIFIRRIILLYLPTSRHLLGVIQQKSSEVSMTSELFLFSELEGIYNLWHI